jgi:hypothetical protein
MRRARWRLRQRMASRVVLPSLVLRSMYRRVSAWQRARVTATRWIGALTRRLPPRSSRWRLVLPELTGIGARPAVPRSYQATPNIPDRRRATQQEEVRPDGSTASKRVSSPPVGTIPTTSDVTDEPNHKASLKALARGPRRASTVTPPERRAPVLQKTRGASTSPPDHAHGHDRGGVRPVCPALRRLKCV